MINLFKWLFIALFSILNLTSFAQDDQVIELFRQAKEYSENENYLKAIKTYQKALDLNVGKYNYALYLNMGCCYAALAEHHLAIEHFDMALLHNVDDYEAFTCRGNSNTFLGHYEKAIKDHKEAIRILENQAGEDLDIAYYNLGDCFRRWGKFDSAIVYYEESLEYEHKDVSTRMNIAFTYIEMQRYQLAEAHLLELIEEVPEISNNHNNLGFVYLQLGDLEKAEKYVLDAQKIEPENSWVYRNLGLIHKAKGEKKQACKQLDKALKLEFVKYWGTDYIQELLDYCNQPAE
ncbi:tetratricopeptide repeat protein [bacterium SCSIO 12741]|nr:tetratricopeptide repeat protein [bacterium SCSIO 12741]